MIQRIILLNQTHQIHIFGINNDISTEGDTKALYIAARLMHNDHVLFYEMQAVLSAYTQKITVIDYASDNLQG